MTIKEQDNPIIKSMYHAELRPEYDKEIMSLRVFLEDIHPITDCNPIGQRPSVYKEDDNKKNVEIIQCVLLNQDIGQITLVDVKDEPSRWTWESIDGGHRKRAIKAYIEGKFKVFGKYYSELSDDERSNFLNYKMSFTLYKPLTTFMKGKIFRDINKTTDVNNQETLNSFGDTPIANLIRELVRVVTRNGKTNVIHDLFEVTSAGNFKWLQTSNERLVVEEFVARFCYRLYTNGDVGSRTFKELSSMYEDDDIDVPKLSKKIKSLLDFLYEMAKARKATMSNGLAKGEMTTLANLYLHLNTIYGVWSLDDPIEFYRVFSTIYNDYFYDPDKKYHVFVDFEFEKAEVSIKECFGNYVSNHDSYEKQFQLMKWITSEFDVRQYITVKDKVRDFPRWMKEITLQKQGYVCAVDGLSLTWEEAEAAHITAHAESGKTILSNCAMVRKKHNQAMGTMSVTEYKKLLKSK